MWKKTNNSLGATATNQAISGASKKKHLRSRKPKFELGKPKQGTDKKKKDKKKKRKETAATRFTKRFDKIRLMFDEIRANIQRAKELDSETNALIADQLKAWDEEDNGF